MKVETMKVIGKNDWAKGLKDCRQSYLLYGPIKKGLFHQFKKLEQAEMPDMNYCNARLPPKSVVFPQNELMFKYSLDKNDPDHHIMKEPEALSSDDTSQSGSLKQRAIIGIRPCDAAAFLLVKKNFDTPEYKDPYWIKAYESLTLVGMACTQPCFTCFCTSAGCGPFHKDGLDVMITDNGDHYYAEAVTEKGEQFMKTAGWLKEAEAGAAQKVEKMRQEAESQIVSHIQTHNLKNKSVNELYDATFWDDISFACINCGTCTFTCPTCWCFDIQDETCGKSGVRQRLWDSCMFPLFTLHGTGHNPRGTKRHRVRQRFMHKLKYYPDRYGNGIQCVGCGRCIRTCPVGIDIRKICDTMNGSSAGPASACGVK